MIPVIDISSLFGPASRTREAADREIMTAAGEIGFLTVTGLPEQVPIGPQDRRKLLSVFNLPEAAKNSMLRQKFDPSRPNVYRGWFPLQEGHATYKEGLDMGPDVAYGPSVADASDPLTEPTPLPPPAALPGWHEAVVTYYKAMEQTGRMLMHSLARSLGLAETQFDAPFVGGTSTFRLIHYPVRSEQSFHGAPEHEIWLTHKGERRYMVGRPHVDTGFLTLLAQDGVEGLQARTIDGTWLDVPPLEGSLAVNFGNTLERWTGGTIKATEHRVIGSGRERFSIPFFYEPRVDAEIAPLPLQAIEPFEPFLYGDHLWKTMLNYVEFYGLDHLRKPRGSARALDVAMHAEQARVHLKAAASANSG